MSSNEYQSRTLGRLIEILISQDQNPRSWQQEIAAEIGRLLTREAEHQVRYDALEAKAFFLQRKMGLLRAVIEEAQDFLTSDAGVTDRQRIANASVTLAECDGRQ